MQYVTVKIDAEMWQPKPEARPESAKELEKGKKSGTRIAVEADKMAMLILNVALQMNGLLDQEGLDPNCREAMDSRAGHVFRAFGREGDDEEWR